MLDYYLSDLAQSLGILTGAHFQRTLIVSWNSFGSLETPVDSLTTSSQYIQLSKVCAKVQVTYVSTP